uniref:SAM domain-containing protein n=1 Tax=Romanomermis culicivorax TaxID=13658 RepID=A0A915KRS4_ROMCU
MNTMCDVMPTISEDSDSHPNDHDDKNYYFLKSSPDFMGEKDRASESFKFEQLMQSEKDKESLKRQLELQLQPVPQYCEKLEQANRSDCPIGRVVEQLMNGLLTNYPQIRGADAPTVFLKYHGNQCIQAFLQEFQSLTRDLTHLREQLHEKDEEIIELKAERNNTRLLLEHLECLVARHERSLRSTVVKRQNQTASGVSSEVEVLKALKSLFEHHKALDEKVRERLRVAMERVLALESELQTSNHDNTSLREQLNRLNFNLEQEKAKFNAVSNQQNGDQSKIKSSSLLKRIPNGSSENETNGSSENETATMTAAAAAQAVELQDALDKAQKDLKDSMQRYNDLSNRISELEENLSLNQKEMIKLQDANKSLSHDLQEANAIRKDQDDVIATLEKRYLATQRESTCFQDLNDNLEQELANKDAAIRLNEEKVRSLQERLELAEQQLAQSLKKAESLPSVEAELQQRLEALSAAERKHLSAEERIRRMEMQVEEKQAELQRALQREKMNEDHNQRLSATVDKLLSESNDRLQLHLKERQQASEEKNRLIQEIEQMRKVLEQIERLKFTSFFYEKNRIIRFHMPMVITLSAEIESSQDCRRFINFGISHMIGKSLVIPSYMYLDRFAIENDGLRGEEKTVIFGMKRSKMLFLVENKHFWSSDPHLMYVDREIFRSLQFSQKITLIPVSTFQVQTLNEQEWERLQQSNILANVQQAFSTTNVAVDQQQLQQTAVGPVAFSTPVSSSTTMAPAPLDLLSPVNAAGDTQSLVAALQDQLDAINREIKLIQEEKQNAEMRAEEIESRVKQRTTATINTSSYGTLTGHVTPRPIHHHYQMQHQQQPPMQQGPYVKYNTLPANASLSHYYQHNSNDQNIAQNYDVMASNYNGATPGDISMRYARPGGVTRSNRADDYLDNVGILECPSGMQQHSPASSAASSQDSLAAVTGGKSLASSKKRSTSASGLNRTLGRLFGKRDKHKQQQQQHVSSSSAALYKTADGGLAANTQQQQQQQLSAYYSDSEISTSGEPPGGLTSSSAVGGGHSSAGAGGAPPDFDRRKRKKHELLEEAMKARTPFALWNGPTIVAWLELWVGMPAWYVAACRANVKSGAIMSALSDQEIQREIGISNPLHRLKLRLAIQEMVSLTSPSAPVTTRTTLAFGDMNHEWIGNEWLPSLGLPQYRSSFMECLVDARMLEHLTKKDLRTHLKMVDSFHRASLQYGILCLKKLNYDRKLLDERRLACESGDKDLLVWSNERVVRWLESVGLALYAGHLRESGVHGAVVSLDETFDANALALTLQIPTSDNASRQILCREFTALLAVAGAVDRGGGGVNHPSALMMMNNLAHAGGAPGVHAAPILAASVNATPYGTRKLHLGRGKALFKGDDFYE